MRSIYMIINILNIHVSAVAQSHAVRHAVAQQLLVAVHSVAF